MKKKKKKMTYQQALVEAHKVGASKAEGAAYLAQVCKTLAVVHAINPEMAYKGAIKTKLDGNAVAKLGPVQLSDLMFV